MTSWVPAQNALLAWVRAATGLDDQHVYLGEQDGMAALPGARVYVSIWDSVGQGVDGQAQTAVDTVAKTVDLTSTGQRRVTVQFRCESPDATDDTSARALLERVQLWASMSTVRPAINAAGLGLLDIGTVRNMPKVMNAGWESHAILESSFCVIQTATETVPYIETVNGEGTFTNPGSSDVEIDFSLKT